MLLVAGGSGVVPLMAMIRARAAAGSTADTRLLFSSRSWDDVIYREELARLEGGGLRVVHTLTRARPQGWSGYARRVDAQMLADVGPQRRPNCRMCTSAGQRPSSRLLRKRWFDSATTPDESRPSASGLHEAERTASCQTESRAIMWSS